MKGPVAFLFLGETLLIPHLYPVVEELARQDDLIIDLWVVTSVHEELLRKWSKDLGPAHIRIRRAPRFRDLPDYHDGRNPPPADKSLTLAGMLPFLLRAPVTVVAEQTSLWVPTLLPWLRRRFIKLAHGSGTLMARDDIRRRSAWRMPVPSEAEQRQYVQLGFDPGYVPVVGSVKPTFRHRMHRELPFPEQRPVVLYNPHWQQHRSSWWSWGREIVQQLVAQNRYNVILAPHQRLVEGDAELPRILADAARHAHVHSDLDSFAMVDGSYTAAADIYLGDTSSQVIEFLARPRPCLFLNDRRVDWKARGDYVMWQAGEVVETLDEVLPALARAPARHAGFEATQRQIAQQWLGDTSGAPARIATHILEALAR
ncbi:MAG: hypothetical protein WDO12_14895 [Pseudomonadota bacterium]